ncbi:MAG: hypothetical protein MHM6MM_005409, partial [Cercozoa sp. M6MM]
MQSKVDKRLVPLRKDEEELRHVRRRELGPRYSSASGSATTVEEPGDYMPPEVPGVDMDLLRWRMPHYEERRLSLVGYSRSAAASFFYVPELSIALDAGGSCKSFLPHVWAISHGHLDHTMHLPVSQPSFVNDEPTNIVLCPKPIAPLVEQFMHAAQCLNRGEVFSHVEDLQQRPYTLRGVEPGENILLPRELTSRPTSVQIFRV